ncbi:HDOD domain-containing protein [Methylomonas sp. EFPC3]|uniref:HDOD domain-containing protein n=1 Tax=Methylomonas sp. EFPC3 TaxID=3021710 RepID=UPI00241627FC|nr:HDOD domain-containing protein [Methylomonas sp. EFPC3]WFP52075.1 HDOD domain-containing protein [Methylomonas sp. EFPC3]
MKVAAIRQLVADATNLFSLPDIYFQLNEMIRDSRYSPADIGAVIAKDPVLAARLLRVVNSPFYGFQARIDTLSRAITVIGVDDLYSLVVATCIADRFRQIPGELVDMASFWRRSIHCAILVRALAKRCAVLHAERLFIAGLLHDIGSLLLYHRLAEPSRQALLAANGDRRLVPGLEQALLGFTHAEVGRELLKNWGLPESLYETVGCYLEPEQALLHKLDAHLLHIACRLADCKSAAERQATAAGFAKQTLILVRISREQILEIADQVDQDLAQMLDLFSPP